MKIWDISVDVVGGMPVWPGDPPPVIERVSTLSEGANISHLSCCAHTGTHVDAPRHYIERGASVEQLPLDVLIGPALVVEFPKEVDIITRVHMEAANIPLGTKRLLCKTRNSRLWKNPRHAFTLDFVSIASDAATWLVERQIALIGVDYLSVESYHTSDARTHRTLLGAGVVVVESLNLRNIEPGEYDLTCLPVKVVGSDGAPARAILTRP